MSVGADTSPPRWPNTCNSDQLKAELATTIATLDTEELQLARQLLHLVLAEQL